MIIIKTEKEFEKIKDAGTRLGELFDYLIPYIKPGISTYEIDKLAEKHIRASGAIQACLGYEGFPFTICASVNECLVHGFPSKNKILKNGDIISVDVVNCYNGWMSDACRTYAVGEISSRHQELIDTAEECFYAGFAMAKPGNRIGDISHAIEQVARKHGFALTEIYGGHGIGRDMHEDPMILNVGRAGYGQIIRPGMAICIEPMLLEGSAKTKRLPDGWGEVSIDKGYTAHYENTVLVTKDGPVIATVDSNVRRHLKGEM